MSRVGRVGPELDVCTDWCFEFAWLALLLLLVAAGCAGGENGRVAVAECGEGTRFSFVGCGCPAGCGAL